VSRPRTFTSHAMCITAPQIATGPPVESSMVCPKRVHPACSNRMCEEAELRCWRLSHRQAKKGNPRRLHRALIGARVESRCALANAGPQTFELGARVPQEIQRRKLDSNFGTVGGTFVMVHPERIRGIIKNVSCNVDSTRRYSGYSKASGF